MDPRLSVVNRRLADVKRIIAVSGGKGGIGKSLTAAVSALHLAGQGYRVGLLDLDFCGPSAHVILGVKGGFPEEDRGILPPQINRLKFMSLVYFTGGNPAPLRGSDISNAIIEILAITRWETLDYLIIDMPPGLGDPALDVIRLVKRVEFLLVTTASRVAAEVLKKELQMLQQLGMPVIGVLENMRLGDNSLKEEILKLQAPFLGAIDFDRELEGALGDASALMQTGFAGMLARVVQRIT
ncbi:MAG: ATPase [Pelotomaculum thermopropionicum]|uniref:ATPase n=1 Tax=Pelotomaculum thermopropionicum TaxID=110500 RepID=A0A101HS71_9FIRM|nr:MAG: ATPase [Pelotomaculum thermopropionicum]